MSGEERRRPVAFNRGAVVRLNSGGPNMIVVAGGPLTTWVGYCSLDRALIMESFPTPCLTQILETSQ